MNGECLQGFHSYVTCVPTLWMMAHVMWALASSLGQEQTRACLNYIKTLVTIDVGGVNVDVGPLWIVEDLLRKLQCAFVLHEKGWGLDPQTFPNAVEKEFASLPMLSKDIKVCLGWDESPPMGHVV